MFGDDLSSSYSVECSALMPPGAACLNILIFGKIWGGVASISYIFAHTTTLSI